MTLDAVNDKHWMAYALQLAKKAQAQDEVPIGAVLIYQNEIVGEGFNQCITNQDPTAHAEIIALRQAAKNLKNYRLTDTTLYVTLEPCVMCAGALLHARVKRLVYATTDPKAGAIESVFRIAQPELLNHTLLCQGNVLQTECAQILVDFFKAKRQIKKGLKSEF